MANIWVLVGLCIVIALILIILIKASLQARKYRYSTVEKVSIGQLAKTITDLNPNGTISLSGEEWSAVSTDRVLIKSGSVVVVTNKDKLILKVRVYD